MSGGYIKITPVIPPKLDALLKNHKVRASEGLTVILNKFGAVMEKDVKQSLSIGGRGAQRSDKRFKNKSARKFRPYTPSLEGQPPHKRTGALQASMGFKVSTFLGEKITLTVGSLRSGSAKDKDTGRTRIFVEGVKYSKHLEDPLQRPYLTPIVENYKDQINRAIRAFAKTLLKGE